jgi:hypothetical protein
MYNRNHQTYLVTVKHPTDYHKGEKKVTVYTVKQDGKPDYRYCDATEFGCSRDYFVRSDDKALELFFAEHACRILSTKKVV